MKCYHHRHQQFARVSSLFIGILLVDRLKGTDAAQANEIEKVLSDSDSALLNVIEVNSAETSKI